MTTIKKELTDLQIFLQKTLALILKCNDIDSAMHKSIVRLFMRAYHSATKVLQCLDSCDAACPGTTSVGACTSAVNLQRFLHLPVDVQLKEHEWIDQNLARVVSTYVNEIGCDIEDNQDTPCVTNILEVLQSKLSHHYGDDDNCCSETTTRYEKVCGAKGEFAYLGNIVTKVEEYIQQWYKTIAFVTNASSNDICLPDGMQASVYFIASTLGKLLNMLYVDALKTHPYQSPLKSLTVPSPVPDYECERDAPCTGSTDPVRCERSSPCTDVDDDTVANVVNNLCKGMIEKLVQERCSNTCPL